MAAPTQTDARGGIISADVPDIRRAVLPLTISAQIPSVGRLCIARLSICIVTVVAVAFLPTPTTAQSDYRIPWLRGIRAITTSVNVVVDGGARHPTLPCQVNRLVLERHGAAMLYDTGLDAIGAVDRMAKLQTLQSELDKALRDWEKQPADARPAWDHAQSERRRSEGDFLAFQPLLFAHVAVASLGDGLCAAGITTELRAFARDKPIINYNGEQVLAPVAIWGALPLALVAHTSELEQAVTERLNIQYKEFISAWQIANGK